MRPLSQQKLRNQRRPRLQPLELRKPPLPPSQRLRQRQKVGLFSLCTYPVTDRSEAGAETKPAESATPAPVTEPVKTEVAGK